jgi:hypothetical protein
MDKTKHEAQILCCYLHESWHNVDQDCIVHLFAFSFSRVLVKVIEKHTSNLTIMSAHAV